MKVPLSWLREYVDITLPLDELAHRLTMSGTEVEDVVEVGAQWERVYVSRIVGLEPHPDAANLLVASVDVGGRGTATIVTGAPNLAVGALVPLVEPGGLLPGGRRIEAQTLRGVASAGMLCSGDELGLSPDKSGIYLLDGEAAVGRPLADLIHDTVLDLYITPNRPDCMSVLGIAREVHALTDAPLRRPALPRPRGEHPASDFVRVTIADPDLCPRFTAGYVAGVTVGPSPGWLQRRLHLAGVRPISNVVDATNYTMLELGQPQHAFDADRLGGQIVVRRARPDERLRTLDEVNRVLSEDTLVIADAEKAVAVAGVMGGAATEVGEGTRNVILETANFYPLSIGRTARALRLPSEASRRFERGLHPDLAMVAAERTIALLVELCGGTAADGIVDAYPRRWEPRRIEVREREIAALLGKTYERAEVARVLESLDFSVEAGGGQLVVTVPMHRLDVEGRADLAEEVARITGYDEIPDTMPTGAMPEPTVDALRAAAERARDVLVGCGLQEVMTYSMVAPGSTARLEDGAASDDEIEASNPLTVDQSVLRSRLLPSLLDTVHDNLRHRERVAIFEIARVYLPPLDPLPSERLRLAIAMTGPADAAAWNVNARSVDFFDLKGAIEELLGAFGVSASYEAAVTPWLHPGRGAAVRLQDAAQAEVELGPFGQLHPDAAERFDLRGREVFVAEIDFERLVRVSAGQPHIAPIPRFPALDRDLALILDRSTSHADVHRELVSAGGSLLEHVSLFDEYRGQQVPEGKRSLAYALRFRAADRTLTDADADAAMARVIEAVTGRFGAHVRRRSEDGARS